MNSKTELYRESEHDDWRVRTMLDATIAHDAPEPSLAACRHAVLRIWAHDRVSWVVYDRLLNRIVDGVYFVKSAALDVASHFNSLSDDAGNCDEGPNTRAPNAEALGLIYPAEGMNNGIRPG